MILRAELDLFAGGTDSGAGRWQRERQEHSHSIVAALLRSLGLSSLFSFLSLSGSLSLSPSLSFSLSLSFRLALCCSPCLSLDLNSLSLSLSLSLSTYIISAARWNDIVVVLYILASHALPLLQFCSAANQRISILVLVFCFPVISPFCAAARLGIL